MLQNQQHESPVTEPAKEEGAVKPGSQFRRVRVDDKRIINCSADLNQLVPIKYKWAWEKYLTGCKNHWMPQEISMQRDIEQWRDPHALTDDERHMLKRNFGFFRHRRIAGGEQYSARHLPAADESGMPPVSAAAGV